MTSPVIRLLACAAVACCCCVTPDAAAQPAGAPAADSSAPPPPAEGETISRDGEGRATVRATRLQSPIRIDGQLDEAIYTAVKPASDFIQMEPEAGQLASERTEVWIFFDRDNLYVTFRAWESHPERMIANEMRRDSGNIRQGDSVEFAVDTFRDRRNAILFEANALGARTDAQSTNERQYSPDWNPVWALAAGRFEGGWTIEAALPFKSIRYPPGTAQDWGFQARRTNKWKNEISYLTRLSPSLGLGRADFSASLYAGLVGIEAPPPSRTFELKPYVIGSLTSDNTAVPPRHYDPDGDAGVDAKYSITPNLAADLTYNTDFAQVEADEQQVNLTRFSLFFPEKRDFFLENQGLFTFGNNSGGSVNTADLPLLFYSRRIGLAGNREVPILGGGRVTGRVGRYQLGLVNMQTREEIAVGAPSTNFSVARVKRDVFRRSAIGALFTSRSHSVLADGSTQAYGVDGTFAFFSNLTIATYVAQTRTPERPRDDMSYRAQMEYSSDRYGLQLERLAVDGNFNPEVGFIRRSDIRRNYALARFSPRPASNAVIRRFSGIGQWTYIEDSAGMLGTRIADGEFAIELQNSDRFSAGINNDYERIVRPFSIIPGQSIQPGAYEFTTGRVGYNFGQQRPFSGNVLVERGSFYGGERTAVTLSRSRVNVSAHLSVEPSVAINWITLTAGPFTTRLLGTRTTYTVTPMLFVSALVQFNSSMNTVSTNARMRWEYRPGSELFIVFNDERNQTITASGIRPATRSFIVKVNRFLRF